MKDKKRSFTILSLVLTFICALISFTVTACKPDEPEKTEGPETGVYYYDASGEEYLITLNSVDKFAFVVKGENKSGTYTLADGKLSLLFNGEEATSVEATLSNDVITLTYDGSEMRFLKKIYYTVAFSTDGGSAVDSVKVINGKTVVRPADPVRAGSVFMGWFKDGEFKAPFAFGSDIITADTTIYARWGDKVVGQTEYDVSFDLNYSGAVNPESVKTVGGKVYNLPVPERDGYTFGGWWVSMYNRAELLSYPYTEDTALGENTTLFALWKTPSSKIPAVTVSATEISWEAILGVGTYHLNVKQAYDADGIIMGEAHDSVLSENLSATVKQFDFSALPAGGYIVSVAADNGDPCERLFVNKALKRVSVFEVVDPSTLIFNKVDNAENYSISVECGNPNHNHTDFSLGNSTTYNFANCAMREGGIKFVVKASASGYSSSYSEVFVYDRTLDKIDGVRFDEQTETLFWNAVPNASRYVVTVAYNENEKEVINVGNKTSFSVKRFAPVEGGLKISVYPATNGYNSPESVEYVYNKKMLAVPTDIRIKDMTLSWAAVDGATGYEINIGGVVVTTTGTTFDLTDSRLSWTAEKYYTLSVRATGATNSLWSDEQDIRYVAMFSTLSYGGSILSWGHVVGADYYEVKLNDDEPFVVDDGTNFAEITFSVPGENELFVRFVDGDDVSEWVGVNVFVYTVSLDSRGGSAVTDVYKALGDKMNLPEPETEGGDFAGWYNVPGGAESNGSPYVDDVFVGNGDLYLYAYYTPKKYTVSFNTGVDGLSLNDIEVLYNRPFSFAVPYNPDVTKTFGGWFTAADGAGAQLTDEKGKSLAGWPFAKDTTLYAFWQDLALKYVLTNVNNKTGYMVTAGDSEYLRNRKDITIPETYKDMPVIVVGPSAFEGNSELETVNIPNTIMQIDVSAFNRCDGLRAVNITVVPNNLLIRYYSVDGVLFDKGKLDEQTGGDASIICVPMSKVGTFTIPDGVATITASVFENRKISAINIPASVTHIGDKAFANCVNLSAVNFIDAEKDGVGLVIASRAFVGCTAIEEITLPKRLEDVRLLKYVLIDETSSQDAHVETSNERTITDSFAGCTSLVGIKVAAGCKNYASVDGILTNAAKTNILYAPAGLSGSYSVPAGIQSVEDGAFLKTAVEELELPAWVSEVGECAFYDCEKLVSVKFTSSGGRAITIGKYAFRQCVALAELGFDDGSNVQTISRGAFLGCTALKEVTLPSAVKIIDDYAFRNCTSLLKMSIIDAANDNTLTFGKEIVGNCSKLTSFYVPRQAINFPSFAGNGALTDIKISEQNPNFSGGSATDIVYDKTGTILLLYPLMGATEFVVPENVVEIGNNAFKGRSIQKITIGKNVTKIGDGAFSGCLDLKEVKFEAGGTENLVIGANAFEKCPSLSSFTVTARTSEIGASAFSLEYKDQSDNTKYYPTGFENFTFEEGVRLTALSGNLFIGTHFTSITIPASVTVIGSGAFYKSAVETVNFESGSKLITIGGDAFSNSRLTEITIPDTVTEIYPSAFYRCEALASVVFAAGGTGDLNLDMRYDDPEGGLSSTSGNVFAYCSLLTEINLPARTVALGEGTFTRCSALKTITFAGAGEESKLKYIGDYAFQHTAIEDIVLPKSLNNQPSILISGDFGPAPYYVLAVGEKAFYSCGKLKKVEFEDGGTGKITLGDGVFYECKELTEIVYPSNLSEYEVDNGNNIPVFGNDLYFNCVKLTSITVADGNEHYAAFDGVLYTADFTELVKCPAAKTGTLDLHDSVAKIGKDSLEGCKYITALIIPATFPDFSSAMFEDLTGLQTLELKGESENYQTYDGALFSKDLTTLYSVPVNRTEDFEIPSTVTTIAAGAFKGSKVSSVTFADGESDLTIEASAFEGSAIISVALPQRLVSLGERAFMSSKSLTTLTFADGCRLTKIPNFAFAECSALTAIRIPAKVTELPSASEVEVPGIAWATTEYYSAFSKCTSLKSVTFENGSVLEKIGEKCFFGLSALETVELPLNLTEIGVAAFRECGLKTITIPASVAKIGVEAFYWNQKLETVIFADGSICTEIGGKAFGSCYNGSDVGLREIIIPSEVVTIGASAFESSKLLASVTFAGNKVTAIGEVAFSNTGIQEFTFPEGVTVVSDKLFAHNDKLESVTLHNAITKLGEMAFLNCVKLTEIDIPDSVTVMGDYCLKNIGITEFVLPVNVSKIPNSMLAGCVSLASVTLHSSLVSIGASAFSGCTSLTSLDLPSNVTSIGDGAFAGSAIENLTVASNNTAFKIIDGVLFNKSGKTIVGIAPAKTGSYTIPTGVTVSRNAFRGSMLSEIIVGNGVKIEQNAFYGANVNKLVIGDGVTIDMWAFSNCRQLESIDFDQYATSATFALKAFENCTKLQKLEINKPWLKLTMNSGEMVEGAFNGCTSLSVIDITCSELFVGYKTFNNCPLTSVKVNANKVVFENNSFYNIPAIQTIEITGKQSVEIGERAFECDSENASLQSLKITSPVINVGVSAFRYNTKLETVDFNAVDSIKLSDYAFSGCLSLQAASFVATGDNSVLELGSEVFYSSRSAYIEDEDGNYIKDDTYYSCKKLTDLEISASDIRLGYYALSHCTAIKEFVVPDEVSYVSWGAFGFWTPEQKIMITRSAAEVAAAEWNENWQDNCDAEIVYNYVPQA